MKIVKLVVPFKTGEKVFVEAEITPVSSGVLADTQKVASGGNYFTAIRTFVTGGIIALIDEYGEPCTDRAVIARYVRDFAFKTVETLSLDLAMLNDPDDDGIEGVYDCPRCGHKVVCSKEGDEDGRDSLGACQRNHEESPDATVSIDVDAFEWLGTEINELVLDYPKQAHYEGAFGKYANGDPMRLQMEAISKGLVAVSGTALDATTRKNFGMNFMEKLPRKALREIVEKLNYPGVQLEVKKSCPKCGKDFEVRLNTANFFASALR